MKKINLIGLKYNRLTVIGVAENTKSGQAKWMCRCDCGGTKIIAANQLRNGKTKSCGCLNLEKIIARSTKHGQRTAINTTSEYYSWRCMKSRCNATDGKNFKNYMERGIIVCERWSSFSNFISDMGKKPSPKHSIERINNNRGYYPENCKWATTEEQSANRRSNIWLEYNGVKQIANDWAKQFGVTFGAFYHQLQRKPIEIVFDFYKQRGLLTT